MTKNGINIKKYTCKVQQIEVFVTSVKMLGYLVKFTSLSKIFRRF